jgi:exodeoxyribonuclease VII large subunit
MPTILPVSKVVGYLKELLDSDPLVGDVWLRGEVSNFTQARSGHCYFTLKDEASQLRCMMWKTVAAGLAILPRDGEEVVARGRVTLYPERGELQLYVGEMQPVGQGVLHQRFEALKNRLATEGLFDTERKRELPDYPRRIGIVTSPTAAALRDILNVLGRRHPLVEVLLSPTLVQGSEAPTQIVRAIQRFERVKVDLVIVARGGGSLEELWAFNEEIVARAICACTVPVISGVGHEVDFTIADFVADQRAPTPSAAAELAVPDIATLREDLDDLRLRLDEAIDDALDSRAESLRQERRALERLSPERQLEQQQQRLADLRRRADQAIRHQLTLRTTRVVGLKGRVAGLDPRATLARGYAIVSDATTGAIIHNTNDTPPGRLLDISLAQGTLRARVERRAPPSDREGKSE